VTVSIDHELVLDLLDAQPTMTVALLGDIGSRIPPGSVRRVSENLTGIKPAPYFADRTFIFGRGADRVGVVFEFQRGEDDDKEWVWPAYAVNFRRRERCPVVLLTLCATDQLVGKFKAQIDIGPGSVFRAVIVGPSQVPKIIDIELAQAQPELTLLSAIAHHDYPNDEAILDALRAALPRVDSDLGGMCYDYVIGRSEAARKYLEEAEMATKTYEYRSEFARSYYAEGEARGEAKGEVKGEAKAVLTVLAARGIEVPEDARVRIDACEDLEQLTEWARRAATADKISELFD
jgi:hypothetical protein